MPFPLIKLGALLVKQLSKPMANAVKRRAKASPTFRKICIAPAQGKPQKFPMGPLFGSFPMSAYHWADVNIKMKLLGLGKTNQVKEMNPDLAVELGAEMIGEGTLYTIVAVIVVAEYAYLAKGTEIKEEAKRQQLKSLEQLIDDLSISHAHLEAQVKELQRIVGELESKNRSLVLKLVDILKKT